MIKYYIWQLHLKKLNLLSTNTVAPNRLNSFLPLEQFHTLATWKILKEAASAKLNPV